MVSIIIPVYNTKPYLGKCIQSVKSQTYKDWECIIVDDGSTDGSGDLLRDITQGDDRFTIITQENSGLASARNKGMEHSRGEYWFFLDSDDWVEPHALATLNRYLESNLDVGRIIGLDMIHWRQYGWNIPWPIKPIGLHPADSPWLFSCPDCDGGHATGCLYVRKNLPEGLVFPDVRKFEDMIFNMGLIFAGVSSYVTNDYIYHYERREGSLVTVKLTQEEADTTRKALQDLIDKYKPSQETRERCMAFLENALG